MEVNNLPPEEFGNLFPEASFTNNPAARFGMDPNKDTDLFNPAQPAQPAQPATPAAAAGPDGGGTPPADGDPKPGENPDDVDILGAGGAAAQPKPGRKPKYDFSDMSGYFEDRIKAGKFIAVEDTLEDGTKKAFVPKTPEEFDEVIDLQVNHKIEQQLKQNEASWLKSKSPAWQAVVQYAELTDDPTEIIPFLTGVQTINSVADINPDELSGAEQIVRTRLEQRGDTQDVINDQIESLKETNKLITTAQKYKPLIVQQESLRLSTMMREKQEEQQEYFSLITNIRDNAIKAIESPIFGTQKLKQEEKAAIYDLIAEPSKETKGYPIYNAIDHLFEAGDFDTLRQIALLISKKDSFLNYASEGAVKKNVQDVQRKLRLATDSKGGSGGKDQPGEDPNYQAPVQRNQYSSGKVRFGRSQQ